MAEQPPTQRCENCRFWQERDGIFVLNEDDEPTQVGRCRRHPPAHHSEPGEVNALAWAPRLRADSWCGEFAPADPETIEDGAATLARFVLLGDKTAARALADKLRE
jgi:hypothetical protein